MFCHGGMRLPLLTSGADISNRSSDAIEPFRADITAASSGVVSVSTISTVDMIGWTLGAITASWTCVTHGRVHRCGSIRATQAIVTCSEWTLWLFLRVVFEASQYQCFTSVWIFLLSKINVRSLHSQWELAMIGVQTQVVHYALPPSYPVIRTICIVLTQTQRQCIFKGVFGPQCVV